MSEFVCGGFFLNLTCHMQAVRLWECSWAADCSHDRLAAPAGGGTLSAPPNSHAASASSSSSAARRQAAQSDVAPAPPPTPTAGHPAALGSSTAQGGSAAQAPPSLLLCFVLAVICGERQAVFRACDSADEVSCHFASLRIEFGRALHEARRLQRE